MSARRPSDDKVSRTYLQGKNRKKSTGKTRNKAQLSGKLNKLPFVGIRNPPAFSEIDPRGYLRVPCYGEGPKKGP